MLKYSELVKSSKGDEEMMWQSVSHVEEFLEEVRKTEPEKVRKFMEAQYEAMNGEHINEWLAKKMVSKMYHTDANGNPVSGEAVTPEEAMTLIADKPAEKQAKCKWDAYVAANAFAHDLGATGISKADIMKAAKSFWFHDEDLGNKHKVYWYFKDWIFE